MNRNVSKGATVVLSPGEDGEFGTADDENDGWMLVEYVTNKMPWR